MEKETIFQKNAQIRDEEKERITEKDIILRPASVDDAEILLKWRNDLETRRQSHDTREIEIKDHVNWLEKSLRDTKRKLYVVEFDGMAVGTVRADYLDGCYELSWTVAPDFRGRGLGKTMVAALAHQISEPIRCEIKPDNEASKSVAEYAGMKFHHEENGILHYRR